MRSNACTASIALRVSTAFNDVPSHPFGISRVGISITTENGHTDQVSVPAGGDSAHTFDIPKNQGKSVRVCVNSENLSAHAVV
jgi:hypothetical protein